MATFAAQSVDAGDAVVIEVASTDDALTALGAAARNRLVNAAVIGITGSVGKTTTKIFSRPFFVVTGPRTPTFARSTTRSGCP